MKTYFSQEENHHSMWDTNGETNPTENNLPRMAVVPYEAVEWLSKGGRTTNEFRVRLEETMRNYENYQKEDWELFFEFSMAASKIYPKYKKSSVLAIDVEPVTATDTQFWKLEDQLLDATLGTKLAQSPAANRGGTSQMDHLL